MLMSENNFFINYKKLRMLERMFLKAFYTDHVQYFKYSDLFPCRVTESTFTKV